MADELLETYGLAQKEWDALKANDLDDDPFVQKFGVTKEEADQQRKDHEAKDDAKLAFEAGKHAAGDANARQHGIAACPFAEGETRAQWLRGFGEGLAAIRIPSEAELKEAIDNASA